jgi:6-pyruvoyltetrahydropterin/6-carboxytetrahydropterin synthase
MSRAVGTIQNHDSAVRAVNDVAARSSLWARVRLASSVSSRDPNRKWYDALPLPMSTHSVFRVSVSKDDLVFSSAHFITFAGHRCEGLHGHNYRVRVTIDGELNAEDGLVFDFLELKRLMRQLCQEIDHLVLLPLRSARITAVEEGDAVHVSVDGVPRYTFPRRDCALLPISNTTVELLAQHLATRLEAALASQNVRNVSAIEMEVEENFGQSAIFVSHRG